MISRYINDRASRSLQPFVTVRDAPYITRGNQDISLSHRQRHGAKFQMQVGYNLYLHVRFLILRVAKLFQRTASDAADRLRYQHRPGSSGEKCTA
jgi:hypothetical protein